MGSAAPSAAGPVAGRDYPRNFRQFVEWFHSEADAWSYISRVRWPEGFSCPRPGCDGGEAWLTDRFLFVCTKCRKQVSLTAGTVFEGSRLSLRDWLYAIWLVAGEKRGVSAKSLQNALGLGSYKTAWLALHKIRLAMAKTSPDLLSGVVEVDESYVGGVSPGKRGRGTDKAIVVIAVERLGWGKKSKRVKLGRVRMRVIPNTQRRTLEEFITDVVEPGSIVHTDGKQEYDWLSELDYEHWVSNQSASDDPAHVNMPGVPSRRLAGEAVGARHSSGRPRPSAPGGVPGRVHVPLQPARQPQPRPRLLPPAGAVPSDAAARLRHDRLLAPRAARQGARASSEAETTGGHESMTTYASGAVTTYPISAPDLPLGLVFPDIEREEQRELHEGLHRIEQQLDKLSETCAARSGRRWDSTLELLPAGSIQGWAETADEPDLSFVVALGPLDPTDTTAPRRWTADGEIYLVCDHEQECGGMHLVARVERTATSPRDAVAALAAVVEELAEQAKTREPVSGAWRDLDSISASR